MKLFFLAIAWLSLADGFSAPFGVTPNGIPYALRFTASPSVPVLSAGRLEGNASVAVEVVDAILQRW